MFKQIVSGLASPIEECPAEPDVVQPPTPIDPPVEINRAIVFQGAFELLNAQWSLDSGRTVDFRIVESPGDDQINPFKQYQRRRNGRVGQSFFATIVADGNETPTYSGDVMLAAWGDNHDKGCWVRFWIDEQADLHPFAGFTRRTSGGLGKFFAGVIVITVEPGGCLSVAAHAGRDDDHSQSGGRKLSSIAHLTVTSGRFCQYLEEKSEYTEALQKKGLTWNADLAKRYVKWKLGVESLSELDRSIDKATKFHEEFRLPYSKWNGKE